MQRVIKSFIVSCVVLTVAGCGRQMQGNGTHPGLEQVLSNAQEVRIYGRGPLGAFTSKPFITITGQQKNNFLGRMKAAHQIRHGITTPIPDLEVTFVDGDKSERGLFYTSGFLFDEEDVVYLDPVSMKWLADVAKAYKARRPNKSLHRTTVAAFGPASVAG